MAECRKSTSLLHVLTFKYLYIVPVLMRCDSACVLSKSTSFDAELHFNKVNKLMFTCHHKQCYEFLFAILYTLGLSSDKVSPA